MSATALDEDNDDVATPKTTEEIAAGRAARLAEAKGLIERGEWNPYQTLHDIERRYRVDIDVADAVPRAVIYLDIGYLMTIIKELMDALQIARACLIEHGIAVESDDGDVH